MLSHEILTEALTSLRELLADRGVSSELVVIGGGGLLLQGVLTRTTADLDVVARVEGGKLATAEPLPTPLVDAAAEVARLYRLPETWLNSGPTDLLTFGLPEGFADRQETRRFGGLTLRLAGRLDQIAFKLYAAVDQGPRSKHVRDLQEMSPTREELQFAARWSLTHDTSPDFRDQLEQALAFLGEAEIELD